MHAGPFSFVFAFKVEDHCRYTPQSSLPSQIIIDNLVADTSVGVAHVDVGPQPVTAFCDLESDARYGWLVIMQRIAPFSLDMNKTWSDYKKGFGNVGRRKEFWLGKLHSFSSKIQNEHLSTSRGLFHKQQEHNTCGFQSSRTDPKIPHAN